MPPLGKKVKFKDIDTSVLAQMPVTGRLNRKAFLLKEGRIRCTVCGTALTARGTKGKSGKDFQNYRIKYIQDLNMNPSDPQSWVLCEICEPCNRIHFELDKWTGAV